jgi:hypothetical protein
VTTCVMWVGQGSFATWETFRATMRHSRGATSRSKYTLTCPTIPRRAALATHLFSS